jgi:hypothetical protein
MFCRTGKETAYSKWHWVRSDDTNLDDQNDDMYTKIVLRCIQKGLNVLTILFLHLSLYTDCFKKTFTTLKPYTNLFRGHEQCF